MKNKFRISFTWDDEACVWVATSEDVPGLVLEHSSFDVLVERVRLAAPELLELNCGYTEETCCTSGMCCIVGEINALR